VTDDAPPWLMDSLRRMHLVDPGAEVTCRALTGGVSSDVYAVDTNARSLCVKRPLDKLRVAADWHASLDRGAREQAWLEFAATVCPSAVPRVLGGDPVNHAFAMELLDAQAFGLWKTLLLNSQVDTLVARSIGKTLIALHTASAASTKVMTRFADQSIFRSLRIDPYFEPVRDLHPALSVALDELIADVLAPIAVVHGDVSPKNILVGTDRVVLLDAECAAVGDPAFDLAFCLTHLVLKTIHRPWTHDGYALLAGELLAAYCAPAPAEQMLGLLPRVARQIGGLLLARVDGKSPVEYLDESQRATVRELGVEVLTTPPKDPLAVFRLAGAGR